MAGETKSTTTSTITIEDDFREEVVQEGRRYGITAWTTMLKLLAKEGLEARRRARGETQ